jgi:threonylcarbamoyladenosine tRNA methylthiotransferase MtaB
MSKTVALHTLGCKLNFSETTAISRMLENDGFVKKEFDEVADVYVINTCSVTDNADKECRQLVRRILKKAPEAMVVITGCYAQLKPTEIASIPGVNLVLGAAEKFNIATHLKELKKNDFGKICSCDIEDVNIFTPTHSVKERTRIFLKVQDGCDYNCSFCTIPMARGKSRSNSIESVLKDIEDGKLGQHDGAYKFGLLLKKIYVDSALKKAEKLNAGTGEKEKEFKGPQVDVSWGQFKKMQGRKD